MQGLHDVILEAREANRTLRGNQAEDPAAGADGRDQAVVLSLTCTELVSNAFEYASPKARRGSFQAERERPVLVVTDDGGFDPESPARGTGLGCELVQAPAAQLRGEVDVTSGRGCAGIEWQVWFPT